MFLFIGKEITSNEILNTCVKDDFENNGQLQICGTYTKTTYCVYLSGIKIRCHHFEKVFEESHDVFSVYKMFGTDLWP